MPLWHINAITLLPTDTVVHCMHYWLAALLDMVPEILTCQVLLLQTFHCTFVYKSHLQSLFQQFVQIATASSAVLAWRFCLCNMKLLLLLLAVLPLAWAQFPAACNTPDSLSTKTCCPNNCGSHGSCVSIVQNASWDDADETIVAIVRFVRPLDLRYQWPTRVFQKVCSCDEGWGSYDCSQCDLAYIDDGNGGCVKRTSDQLLVRRNFMDLTHQQQLDYIRVLREAKNEAEDDREWAAVVKEPFNKKNGTFVLQNVSIFDMLAVVNYLTGRDKDNFNCETLLCPPEIDFGHKHAGFSTWHRYHLIILERELHKVAKRIGVNDFSLAYWDFGPGESLFSYELFGTPELSPSPVQVNGSLFEDWPVVYHDHYRATLAQNGFGGVPPPCTSVRELNDIEAERLEKRRVERGRICDRGWVIFLPDDGSIAMCLTERTYERINHGLEGFYAYCAGENPPCLGTTLPNMQGAARIYISGLLRDVPASASDPLFFLLLANIDRAFEAWMRKWNGNLPAFEPVSGDHPGHNRDEFLVPLFPPKTNADMYKISSEFGFKYDSMPWNVTSSTPMPPNCNLPPATECDKGGYYPTEPPLPDHCPPGDFVCPRNSTTMVKLPWCGGQKHLLPYCNKRRRWVAWCRNRQHLPWCQSS